MTPEVFVLKVKVFVYVCSSAEYRCHEPMWGLDRPWSPSGWSFYWAIPWQDGAVCHSAQVLGSCLDHRLHTGQQWPIHTSDSGLSEKGCSSQQEVVLCHYLQWPHGAFKNFSGQITCILRKSWKFILILNPYKLECYENWFNLTFHCVFLSHFAHMLIISSVLRHGRRPVVMAGSDHSVRRIVCHRQPWRSSLWCEHNCLDNSVQLVSE